MIKRNDAPFGVPGWGMQGDTGHWPKRNDTPIDPGAIKPGDFVGYDNDEKFAIASSHEDERQGVYAYIAPGKEVYLHGGRINSYAFVAAFEDETLEATMDWLYETAPEWWMEAQWADPDGLDFDMF